jgi:hypothetical protein
MTIGGIGDCAVEVYDAVERATGSDPLVQRLTLGLAGKRRAIAVGCCGLVEDVAVQPAQRALAEGDSYAAELQRLRTERVRQPDAYRAAAEAVEHDVAHGLVL